jgi:hypothetical protein
VGAVSHPSVVPSQQWDFVIVPEVAWQVLGQWGYADEAQALRRIAIKNELGAAYNDCTIVEVRNTGPFAPTLRRTEGEPL